jgi:hypothetical protein
MAIGVAAYGPDLRPWLDAAPGIAAAALKVEDGSFKKRLFRYSMVAVSTGGA